MKKLSNLITLVCLFFAVMSYGQSTINWSNNNKSEKAISKQGSMNANWLIESLVIEMALYDFSKNNNIESAFLLRSNALKNNDSPQLFRSNKNSLLPLDLKESVFLKRFSTKGQESKGTAPIHLIPEKYPQIVSAVPPKFSFPIELGSRPKSFGPVLKF